MAKYMELSPCIIGYECYVIEGNNELAKKSGVIIDETKMLVRVQLENDLFEYRFSKRDMKPFGADKGFIEDYTLVIPDGLC